MPTPSGSAPASPRADPPTITVEEHVDAPATPVDTPSAPVDTETKTKAESEVQDGLEEGKVAENGLRNVEAAAEAEVAEKPAAEIALPASPGPDAASEPEPVVANVAGESSESSEPLNPELSDASNASNKDLPLPPTDEATSVENATTNERVEEVAEVPVPVQENGHIPSELSTSPEVVVRAPSTDLPPTPSAPEPAPASAQEIELHSAPPPIPEKIKSPVDRSSAAAGFSHRNASVSSVRTSTPGPGSRPSISSATSSHHRANGSRSFVSPVVITSALDSIAASREAKRSAPFRDSITHALDLVKSGKAAERPREVFEPLRMAVETHNEKLMVTGLDCIAKLVSHGFFAEDVLPEQAYSSPPPSPAPGAKPAPSEQSSAQLPLADLVTNTITAAYTDSTPDPVSLQIVKALLSLVLSSTILVHHSSLLKAVRTVYNVFLLSNDAVNQMVAQGGLTQMVNHVFARCKVGEDPGPGSFESRPASRGPLSGKGLSRSASAAASVTSLPVPNGAGAEPDAEAPASAVNGAADSNAGLEIVEPSETDVETLVEPSEPTETPRTLEMFEAPNPNDELKTGISGPSSRPISNNDLFIKDAFLVFRALCKLTMKPLGSDSERELKSHAMRSKLLSLHLVLTVLDTHMSIFVDPYALIFSSSNNEATPFLQAVKQYLCLALSRNAISSVTQVFDISVEIFWRILNGLRTKLKKEIEVLFVEIFIPIMDMRQATAKQKSTILTMFAKLCQDPQALVDIYLNYDCDRQALENIYERLMNTISKAATSQNLQLPKGSEASGPTLAPGHTGPSSMPPSLSTTALTPHNTSSTAQTPAEIQLNRQGLECLVSVLRSLVTWGTGNDKLSTSENVLGQQPKSAVREDFKHDSMNGSVASGEVGGSGSGSVVGLNEAAKNSTPDLVDDPGKFETAKYRKTMLLEGVKKFNFKQKKGIQFLLEKGFIESKTPQAIAKFLISTDGLSKAALGEYLGEGEEENIAVMHAFVDLMDFTGSSFVEALRLFLQSFRLPGEAQKIDRFMLKFAARYISQNPQSMFKDADPAYVLAYSVILLNTDAYNPQVKRRMTKQDFVKNNRGINDGGDLPEEMLSEIYDDIQSKEIRMKDEEEAIALQSINTASAGLAGAIANVGRDFAKEEYVMQTTGMANKTEALLKTMMRSQRKGTSSSDQFFSASHFIHVKPMFEVAWMPFIAGLSTMQNTDDMDLIVLCLDGFKQAIRIACFFDLELERNAFVTTLANFTFLNNLGEMKTKNMEAIKALLDVAVSDGNHLRGSWHEVLTCVSQLERMSLIGSREADTRKGKTKSRKLPAEELANESRSRHITVAADMVFSLSHYLSGSAIQDFVQALSDVSWEEIQSLGLSEQPRLFSLQKLVDISYYNMGRIRLEWSNMWNILGEHFNRVCCHTNPTVSFFALDALRQLAMRFLEKEELANFKFQKDFLKPFEYTMVHNHNPDARDLVLQCLQQMIQTRVQNIRSGWRTMFGVFAEASKVLTESVAQHAFEIVSSVNKDHFGAVVRNGAFADLTVCMTDFCKVTKFQKISLLAINMLRAIIPTMLNHPDCALTVAPPSPRNDGGGVVQLPEDPLIKFWFPVLFSFYNIIMEAEDLEVRKMALNSLFSSLKTYGTTFPPDFWDHICQKLLFPIFDVLKNSQEMSRLSTAEDMNIWVSTTMIQALRELVDLYTHFFELLARSLGGLLDLLSACICLKNDTISRIGTSCLQQFLENNAGKLSNAQWDTVVMTFLRLFKGTTPHQLFDESLRVEGDVVPVAGDRAHDEPSGPLSPLTNETPTSGRDRSRIFKDIIMKCVIQLLLIETTNDLLQNKDVYTTIPPDQLLKLMSVLDHSYQFARSFNADKELRTGLWKVGFMKHLPNLLKQESSSASCLINVSLRMYYDKRPEYQAQHAQVADRLMPLGLQIIEDFNGLRTEGQGKNVATWTPVVAEIMRGFLHFDDQTFARYLPALYPLATELIVRDTAPEIRQPLSDIFVRIGRAKGIVA